ncbi:hypothetical protein NW762_000522 [Fusarium torreyae]|uniref:Uncharacterized protein n=1 Tax=Fusarium torreyae TaxID=1237075 RepID=A0A9W8SIL0_9HYPO|nr:hypothetical protein NW762_000522 [Fusarium torreyae]
MAVFFTDWDLWQEMTFILGCCIVLVFVIGLIKLWWSNRAMRRLEIIDEEKRARVSLMSHCGINTVRAPEIPFGIRAIQSGVEVEGIWISRPNSPESCQLTPGATLVGRRIEISKGKGRMIDLGSSEFLAASINAEVSHAHNKDQGHYVLDYAPDDAEQESVVQHLDKTKLGGIDYPRGFRQEFPEHITDISYTQGITTQQQMVGHSATDKTSPHRTKLPKALR